jgi:uncharacterized membrane protein YfcA
VTNIISLDLLALLAICTVATSAFAAVLGQGGGIMLMGVLATVIPAPVLVPLHGIIQAASNGSRAALAFKHVNWAIILPILTGTILGALFVTPFINLINWQWMQIIIGLFIIWSIWGKSFTLPIPASLIGFAQGSLGVLLGATGPLGNAYLYNKGLNKNAIIASNAIIMLSSHLLKVAVFFFVGIGLHGFWFPIIVLSCAAILGSYFGTYFRNRLTDQTFFVLFKVLLTALAINMVLKPFYSINP